MMATYRALLRRSRGVRRMSSAGASARAASRSFDSWPAGRSCRRERPICDERPHLAIVGGGLAGLAAAVEAARARLSRRTVRAAQSLGGRAGSLIDSQTGQRIDYCQHVAMGCCTGFLDFCRRAGIEDCFQRTGTLHFFGPEGDRHDFAPSRWLPAPLHLLPGLMRLKYLSFGERWGIVRTLRRKVLVRTDTNGRRRDSRRLTAAEKRCWGFAIAWLWGLLNEDKIDAIEETIGTWLRRQGQSDRALERFWSVVLTNAWAKRSIRFAGRCAKVFQDGFLASRGASDLLLPRLTLGEIFHDRSLRWLANHGVRVHLGSPPARRRQPEPGPPWSLPTAPAGVRLCVLAVHWHAAAAIGRKTCKPAMPAMENIERIKPAEITAVHLWFDRPAVPLPHAVLVGRLSQWVFGTVGSRAFFFFFFFFKK